MRVLAYCDARYEGATRQAAGGSARLVVAPPARVADWLMLRPETFGLLYFNFHAVPGMAAWLTTTGDTALTAADLAGLDLSRAVVYMVNCYAGGGMLDALRACKPRAIIGGEGENLGALRGLAGADLLGQWVRRALAVGLSPRAALGVAKLRLQAGAKTASAKDALDFRVL